LREVTVPIRLSFLALAAALFCGSTALADSFPIDRCAAPPANSGKAKEVDQCGPDGGAPETEPEHRAQNEAKNNLCVPAPGAPRLLRQADFLRLQKAADDLVKKGRLEYGQRNNLPKDRSVLKNLIRLATGVWIGEGSPVSLIGFVSHPRNSNVEKGESVNCQKPGAAMNDIHFDIVQDPGDEACKSVTGEIIPHYRAAAYEVSILRLTRIGERPIRVSGQLFFDASHLPCRPGATNKPPLRAAVWEIHPVYRIEVCRKTSLAACPSNNAALWVPLESFVNTVHEDDD
jgi:hypothetical protein